MKYAICDLEANGLLYPATKVHCICWTDGEEEFTSTDIPKALESLDKYDCVVFHGGGTYDIPLLKKLYDWGPKRHIDTHLLSRMLEPDRGGHSIEDWAAHFGMQKEGKDITDWSVLTDEMLTRCQNDVRVGYKVFMYLKEKML